MILCFIFCYMLRNGTIQCRCMSGTERRQCLQMPRMPSCLRKTLTNKIGRRAARLSTAHISIQGLIRCTPECSLCPVIVLRKAQQLHHLKHQGIDLKWLAASTMSDREASKYLKPCKGLSQLLGCSVSHVSRCEVVQYCIGQMILAGQLHILQCSTPHYSGAALLCSSVDSTAPSIKQSVFAGETTNGERRTLSAGSSSCQMKNMVKIKLCSMPDMVETNQSISDQAALRILQTKKSSLHLLRT